VTRPVERFDPEGSKEPKGEWKLGKPSGEPDVEAATGTRQGSGRGGWELASGGGAKEPNGQRKRLVSRRSGRPGTLTPEWRL